MAELRTKVMTGAIKPITAGKYSLDLVLLMQSLLHVTPSKRPSIDKILASGAVQKRIGSLRATSAAESHVIGTIKVAHATRLPGWDESETQIQGQPDLASPLITECCACFSQVSF